MGFLQRWSELMHQSAPVTKHCRGVGQYCAQSLQWTSYRVFFCSPFCHQSQHSPFPSLQVSADPVNSQYPLLPLLLPPAPSASVHSSADHAASQFRTEPWGREGEVCLAPPPQPYSLPGPGLSDEQMSGNGRQRRNRGRRGPGSTALRPLPLCATLTYLLLLFCLWTVSLTQGAPAWAWSLAVLSSSESCRRDRHLHLQVETPLLMEMLISRWEGPCHWQETRSLTFYSVLSIA